MKKILKVIIFIFLLSLSTGMVYAEELPVSEAIYGTPVIDGYIDSIWENAHIIIPEKRKVGETGSKAKVRTMWDSENLYVLVEVQDSVLSIVNKDTWEQDGIEIYIDENNSRKTEVDEDDCQIRISLNGKLSGAIDSSFKVDKIQKKFKKTSDGYIAEIAIPFTNKKDITKDNRIGFEIGINDDHGAGQRESQLCWASTSHNGWNDTSLFGTLILLKPEDGVDYTVKYEEHAPLEDLFFEGGNLENEFVIRNKEVEETVLPQETHNEEIVITQETTVSPDVTTEEEHTWKINKKMIVRVVMIAIASVGIIMILKDEKNSNR